MLQAYRFALDPSPAQERLLASHCGAARKAFNEGLAHVKRCLDQREAERSYGVPDEWLTEVPWTLPALRRWWNASKSMLAPWWAENSKEAYNSGLDALARGLRAWSQSRSGKRRGPRAGFPRFKTRRRARVSCRFTTGAIRVDDATPVGLPRSGRIHTLEQTGALLGRVAAGTARGDPRRGRGPPLRRAARGHHPPGPAPPGDRGRGSRGGEHDAPQAWRRPGRAGPEPGAGRRRARRTAPPTRLQDHLVRQPPDRPRPVGSPAEGPLAVRRAETQTPPRPPAPARR